MKIVLAWISTRVYLEGMSNMIDATESARLDDVTAYCATILAQVSGAELDEALAGWGKRYGKSDADYRNHALRNTHPDDLVLYLVNRGYTLSRFGITSITVG